MYFKHNWEYYQDKLEGKNLVVDVPYKDDSIEDSVLKDALCTFIFYIMAIKGSQKPKKIKRYKKISLRTYRLLFPELSKEQSRLYYDLGIKYFVEGVYTGNPDPKGLFDDLLQSMGAKFSKHTTADLELTIGETHSRTCLLCGHMTSSEGEIFVDIPPLDMLMLSPDEYEQHVNDTYAKLLEDD